MGDWKVTRIVTYQWKGRYGDQYLGSEIGRCISITPDSISDSRTLEEAKQDNKAIYDFSYEKYDISEGDLTNEEKEYLAKRFPLGYYILERAKCQKTIKIWGSG